MNVEQYTISMFARAMWHSGFQGDTFNPQLAELVGHVYRNRVQGGLGQVGWLEAIQFHQHFSHEIKRADDPQFLRVLWEAEKLYLNQVPDKTGGALDYSHKPLGTICLTIQTEAGAVYFYKEPEKVSSLPPDEEPDFPKNQPVEGLR